MRSEGGEKGQGRRMRGLERGVRDQGRNIRWEEWRKMLRGERRREWKGRAGMLGSGERGGGCCEERRERRRMLGGESGGGCCEGRGEGSGGSRQEWCRVPRAVAGESARPGSWKQGGGGGEARMW